MSLHGVMIDGRSSLGQPARQGSHNTVSLLIFVIIALNVELETLANDSIEALVTKMSVLSIPQV